MENIVINFRDYSPIKDIAPEEKEYLKEIWPEESADRCVELLCHEIQDRISETAAKDIYMLNLGDERKPSLFSYFNGELWTQGYVGVINIRIQGVSVTVNFRSRFDDKDSRFLMYVFEKAFGVKGKIYEQLAVTGSKETTWDFLLMLIFVNQLHEAIKKGMYKQYQEFAYNDSNVKGRIDIARHIRGNMLSNGKVSYVTREFTADNSVNRLILRACLLLEKRYRTAFGNLLISDEISKKGIEMLKNEIYDWTADSDRDIIKASQKKIVQSVYKKYEPLRKTSIAILKRMGINSFKNSTESVSGLLIDMPGLWETFLYKQIFCKLQGVQSEYRQEEYPILEGKRNLKPDFLLKEQGMVVDAKYKAHWGNAFMKEDWSQTREDVFQIMSYMYAFKCQYGGVVFPVRVDKEKAEKYPVKSLLIGQECDAGASFLLMPFCISDEVDEGNLEFRKQMDMATQRIIEMIRERIVT